MFESPLDPEEPLPEKSLDPEEPLPEKPLDPEFPLENASFSELTFEDQSEPTADDQSCDPNSESHDELPLPLPVELLPPRLLVPGKPV